MPSKRVLLTLSVVISALVIYLNRSYAHIYSYDQQNKPVISIQREYSLEGGNGKESLKYVALGDSLTYGLGAKSYQGTFPYTFSQRLLGQYKKVEVLNLAVPGATAGGVLSSQLPQAIQGNPGLITVMIGTNDVHNFSDKQEFRDTLISIIDSLQKNTRGKILLINIPYLGTEKLILFPYNNLMDRKIKDYNQVIYEVAKTYGVKYFDLYSVSKGPFKKNPDYYSSDDFHPSELGYILWGNLISAD